MVVVEDPLYYKVEFTVQGKHFPCVVRFRQGDRHWLCVYYNKENKNDWFVRKEVISNELIKHGKQTTKEVFNYVLNKALNEVDNEQFVNSY